MQFLLAALSTLLVLALASGCLDQHPQAVQPSTPEEEAAPDDPAPALEGQEAPMVVAEGGRVQRVTSHLQGRMTTEAASYLAGPQQSEDWLLRFDVGPNATAVVVEVAWNDTVQDLDAVAAGTRTCFDRVPFPQSGATCLVDFATADGTYGVWWNRDGSIGRPDSTSRVVATGQQLKDAGIGTWQAYTWTKDANVDLEFHLFATVFYDGSDPGGFTAVPWA